MTTNTVYENNSREAGYNERVITPPASINETSDGFMLELEMPGVSKEGLEISIDFQSQVAARISRSRGRSFIRSLVPAIIGVHSKSIHRLTAEKSARTSTKVS